MKTFLCKTCNQKFEAEGIRFDWNDPIYGPCSKLTATCPCNGEDCDEFRPLKSNKELEPTGASCGAAGCSCRQ